VNSFATNLCQIEPHAYIATTHKETEDTLPIGKNVLRCNNQQCHGTNNLSTSMFCYTDILMDFVVHWWQFTLVFIIIVFEYYMRWYWCCCIRKLPITQWSGSKMVPVCICFRSICTSRGESYSAACIIGASMADRTTGLSPADIHCHWRYTHAYVLLSFGDSFHLGVVAVSGTANRRPCR